jgi:uncharacterized membrane protein
MEKIKYLWEELKASFWFIPILMILFTLVSALGFIYLDSKIGYSQEGILKYLLPASVDSARSILTIIAGAMIGIAGTVFSITLVVLTLASSQLGSRLVRNFMYDKLNQVVLGTYVSSFVYCLIILSSLKENESFEFIPAISVLAAIVSAIVGIILLIVFIHHVSMSIQSDKVISEISDAMFNSIKKLFPDDTDHDEEKPIPDYEILKQKYAFKLKINCRKSGYLQSFDGDRLLTIAQENDAIIILHYRPGDFLVKEVVICEVLSNKEIKNDLNEKIHNNFIIGKARTPLQDAEFSIHQMVELASRALSPGVNDPYTANACIDNLTSVMCYLAKVEFPKSYGYDSDNKIRVIGENYTFAGMLNAAFNQIRQYAERNPSVMIRLLEAMNTINKFTRNNDQKEQVYKHAEMVMKAAERTFHEQHDLDDMKKRYKTIRQMPLA